MSSRQQQQSGTQPPRSNTQSFQKTNYNQGTPQGPPPPYPSPNTPNKRFKSDNGELKSGLTEAAPSTILTHQQMQLLSFLQQNAANLTPAQQVSLYCTGIYMYKYLLFLITTDITLKTLIFSC